MYNADDFNAIGPSAIENKMPANMVLSVAGPNVITGDPYSGCCAIVLKPVSIKDT
jgi:hypothetical protein